MAINGSTLSARQTSILPVRERQRHTREEWELHKELIRQMYLDEDKSLDETMKYMREHHDFHSGSRQYKNKLREWEFEKYIKMSVMSSLLAKAGKRKFEEDKETRFRYKGKDILPSRMDHFSKRSFVKNGKRVSPDASTPSFVSYSTASSRRSILSNAMSHFIVNNASAVSIVSSVSSSRRKGQELRRSLSNAMDRTRNTVRRLLDRSPPTPPPLTNAETAIDEMDCYRRMEYGSLQLNRCDWKAGEQTLLDCLSEYEGHLGPDSRYILDGYHQLGYAYFHQGRYEDAKDAFEHVLNVCREYYAYKIFLSAFGSLEYLAKIHAFNGTLYDVEQKLLQEQANQNPSTMETEHDIFCQSLYLAYVRLYQGRIRTVVTEFEDLRRQSIRLFGSISTTTVKISLCSASTYEQLGEYTASMKVKQETLLSLTRDQTEFEKHFTDDSVLSLQASILSGLSEDARCLRMFKESKQYSMMAIKTLNNLDLSQRRKLIHFMFSQMTLAIAFDNEGNDVEAENLFSQIVARLPVLQALDEAESTRIVMNIQYYYNDRPRRITMLEPTLDDLLFNVQLTFESISYWTIDVGIHLAEYLSRQGCYERADYLFNQARAIVRQHQPSNAYLCMTMMASHSRRLQRWKDAHSSLIRALALAKKIYGHEHRYAIHQAERLEAFRKAMDRKGILTSLPPPSISSFSMLSICDVESDSQPDEIDFLETGEFWGSPPAALLEYA